MIFAILRAQLLSLRSLGLTKSAGAWLSAIPALFFYGFWCLIGVAAYGLCRSVTDTAILLPWVSGGLLAVFVYWQIAPVITSSMGASLDLQKLIVYPIPLDQLFMIEVMLRFLTVGEMLVVLVGAAWGLVRNPVTGGWPALPRILVAWMAFIVFNLLIGAGIRSVIERAFQRRRMKEAGMLVFVLLCAIPGALAVLRPHLERAIPFLPLQRWYPWGAAAGMAISGDAGALAIGLAMLAAWLAAAYWFGRRQFYRALRSDPYAGRQPAAAKQSGAAPLDAIFRLPGRLFADPLAAMMEKEFRSLSRCSGFRLVFIMGFTFSLLLFLPPLFSAKQQHTFMTDHVLAWISIYSILLSGFYTFWNAFGFDRSAAQFYFSAPVRFSQVIAAKNLAAASWQTIELMIISLIYLALPIATDWRQVPEAFAVTAVACLFLFGMGNITSVRYGSPMDPDKVSRGASGRSKGALATLVMPVAFLPITLAYWGLYVFHSEPIFYLLLLLAALIGAVVYWIATESAIDVTLTRREKMIAALSNGSGPLISS